MPRSQPPRSGILQMRPAERRRTAQWPAVVRTQPLPRPHLGVQQEFEDKIVALKTPEVVAALRKHLDPAKVTDRKAGDFSKNDCRPRVGGGPMENRVTRTSLRARHGRSHLRARDAIAQGYSHITEVEAWGAVGYP